jgi:hemerythrin superfamily protein
MPTTAPRSFLPRRHGGCLKTRYHATPFEQTAMKTPRLAAAAPSAVSMIKADHAAALTLFRKLTPDTGDMVREATLRRLCTALEIHAQVEEELFYAPLRSAGIDSLLLDKSSADHDEMRRHIEQLRAAAPGAAQTEALNTLMNGVMHHMADEETKLLPHAETALGAQRLADIGAVMTQRKLELAKPQAGRLALDTVRAAPAKTGLVAAAMLLATTWWMLRRPRQSRLDMP